MTIPASIRTGHLTDRIAIATDTGLHTSGRHGHVFADRRIDAVAADDDDLWVLIERRHLHRIGGDGGTELVATLDTGGATCLGVHDCTVWAGGDEAGLWRLTGTTLEPVTSFDDAPTHSLWSTPWGGPPAVFSIAGHGDDLYVSVHVGGILRSSDGGRSWTPTIDLDTDVHQVAVGPDGVVWAATGTSGLGESCDGGKTWRFHTAGLHATYLLAVAVTDDGPIVSAASGHAGRDGALYRFDGDSLHRCTEGLPSRFDGAVSTRHLAAAGPDVVAALPDGTVHTSSDHGRTWSRLHSGPANITEVILTAPG